MRKRWSLPPRIQMVLMVFIGILMLGGPLILAFYNEAKFNTEHRYDIGWKHKFSVCKPCRDVIRLTITIASNVLATLKIFTATW